MCGDLEEDNNVEAERVYAAFLHAAHAEVHEAIDHRGGSRGRLKQHNAGTASRYTRSRLPVVAVYREAHASRSLALRREAAIKALSRRQKEALIRLAE